jgi:hypothetical protein
MLPRFLTDPTNPILRLRIDLFVPVFRAFQVKSSRQSFYTEKGFLSQKSFRIQIEHQQVSVFYEHEGPALIFFLF